MRTRGISNQWGTHRGNRSKKKRLHPKPLRRKSLSSPPPQKKGGTKTFLKKMTFLPLQELASDGEPDHCKSTIAKPLIRFLAFWIPLSLFFIDHLHNSEITCVVQKLGELLHNFISSFLLSHRSTSFGGGDSKRTFFFIFFVFLFLFLFFCSYHHS
jgi:hypothetical protein